MINYRENMAFEKPQQKPNISRQKSNEKVYLQSMNSAH